MKVLILAGGMGTRLSEETTLRPKPMVEIGDKPILWHIMKQYSHYGFNEFIILLGYKGYFIKEYFANYFLHQSDVTIDMSSNSIEVHNSNSEDWKVSLIDTGLHSMTGGRIKRVQKFVGNEPFLLTYGDGVSDIDISKLVKNHKENNKIVTMSAVQPEGRFGALDLNEHSQVNSFIEKPKGDGSWINGGFFVCQPEVFNYIKDDQTIFEQEPLKTLSQEKQVNAFQHHGFWKCMDTLRDKQFLNQHCSSDKAPWMVWK
ncbi:MAG: glucose-1-phosphate cytidylyltransferase [Candidatus Cloacimonetes bacterium]|nr:glucose-1-phosphate cytidylyltransferase [Candidatus Cloacimonadota bacterium]